jgi:hypothetical protein
MWLNFLGLFFSDRQNIFRSDKMFMSVSPNDWQLLSKIREVWRLHITYCKSFDQREITQIKIFLDDNNEFLSSENNLFSVFYGSLILLCPSTVSWNWYFMVHWVCFVCLLFPEIGILWFTDFVLLFRFVLSFHSNWYFYFTLLQKLCSSQIVFSTNLIF